MNRSIPASPTAAIPRYVDRRVRLTVSTAACLWGMYSAYTIFFSPLLAPRIDSSLENKLERQELFSGNQPEERRQAEQHLSAQPWAAEPKGYHFRTDSGFFYFKKWDNQDETDNPADKGRKVRFTPFAMIWRPKGHDPEKPPFTIVSESAVVEFSSPFEISNANPGRVIGGALVGDVQIRGPEGLAIDGQQFYFGEQVQRVWSDHAVKFRHGRHSGRATGVELDLIPHPNPQASETLAVTGVRTVRLLKAVEMELVPGASSEKPGDPVLINCQGAFEYDVVNHIAKFEKNVQVRQPTGNGQMDHLKCNLLTLIFEPEQGEKAAAASSPPGQPAAPGNNFDVKLKFRRLLAEGAEVVVVSQRSDMQGWMTSLTYDEQSRIIALMSDARPVRLLQKNNELLCPEITAVLDEERKQIERVECRGSGQLYQYAQGTDQNAPTAKKVREVSAKWQRRLNKAPDPATGLDLIELEGRAELKRVGEMSLEADVIGIWVTRGNGRIDSAGSSNSGSSDDDAIQPKKLLALRDVRFASPQIGGRTENLAVWFEEGRLPDPPVAPARKVSRASIRAARPDHVHEKTLEPLVVRGQSPQPTGVERESPAVRRREADRPGRPGLATIDDSPAAATRNPATKPAKKGAAPPGPAKARLAEKPRTAAPDAGDAAMKPDKRRDNPLAVTADLIQVRAMRDGDKTEVSDVITEGRVHVQQEHANGEQPLDVTGDKLLLENYGDTNQILQVFGKPAQVQDRKMRLEGPAIRFDRVANQALVTGAGVLRVPVPNGIDGKPLAEPQILDVFWKEKMEFDGKVAKFFAKVRSQLSGSELRCEEMHVTFDRRISFAEDDAGDQKTEIHSIVCRDGVDLKSYEYEDNVLTSVRTARGFEFKFNQTTGRVFSQGPGTLELWRRSGGKRGGERSGANVKGNSARTVESTGWEYTRIDFDGTMVGSTKDRETTFREVKRVVYGAVPSSTDTIDEENLPKDGGWMRCEELTLTQVPEIRKSPAHTTLKATGNVQLDGRSFHAQSHVVTYDESKDLYTLTGDGKSEATIWRETKPGAPKSGQSAQRMQFIPRENKLFLDRVSGGEAVR